MTDTDDSVSPPGVEATGGGEFARLDAYVRAANYLTAGQIYRMDNPLLRRPLVPTDIKPAFSAIGGRALDSTSSTPTWIGRFGSVT